MKWRKGWRMSCDIGEVTERLENELWCKEKQSSFSNLYVTTHSPILPSLYLRHTSFSNPSVASPTSQFIPQLFFRFSYVTSSSLRGDHGWDFCHFRQNSLFHFIESIWFTYYYLWFSEVLDLYHCCTVIYQATWKFLYHLNTL